MHLPGSRARSEPRPPPSPSPPALALTVTLTLSRVALTLAPTLPLNPEPDRRQATTGAHQRRSKRRCRHPGALGSALPSSLPSALPSALSSSLPSSPPSTRPSGARSAARTGSRQRSGSVGCNERARGLWRSELGLCPRGTLGVGGRGGRGGYRRGWRLVMRLQRAVESALVRLLAAACSVELHGRFRFRIGSVLPWPCAALCQNHSVRVRLNCPPRGQQRARYQAGACLRVLYSRPSCSEGEVWAAQTRCLWFSPRRSRRSRFCHPATYLRARHHRPSAVPRRRPRMGSGGLRLGGPCADCCPEEVTKSTKLNLSKSGLESGLS